MKPHRSWLLAALLSATQACVPAAPPSICDLRSDELIIFPAGDQRVPTNVVVRVLTGGRADDLHIALTRTDGAGDEAGSEVLYETTFGDMVELTPSFTLESNTDYRIEVFDRLGDTVATAFFTTETFGEAGPAGADGDVYLERVEGAERACCTGDGCVDGTSIQLPPLRDDNFSPQLLLVRADEMYNDACGATSATVGYIPVIWEGPSAEGVVAESDLLLEGCFELSVLTQTSREVSPGGVVCTPGYSFSPRPPTADCRRDEGGCACSVTALPSGSSALLTLFVLALMLARRRELV